MFNGPQRQFETYSKIVNISTEEWDLASES